MNKAQANTFRSWDEDDRGDLERIEHLKVDMEVRKLARIYYGAILKTGNLRYMYRGVAKEAKLHPYSGRDSALEYNALSYARFTIENPPPPPAYLLFSNSTQQDGS